jgi:hypothetical protein
MATSERLSRLICSVFLPTVVSPNRWVLRGVSLVCEPDE